MQPGSDGPCENFGKNVRFTPKRRFKPRHEHEILDVLARYRDRSIRVVGALHSWSRVAVGDDVVLDLEHFDKVTLERRNDRMHARVGAGCRIENVAAALREDGWSLPTYGMTGRQTLAGAIATGTHGSGTPSLAHYVTELRVAGYDENGQPTIRVLDSGEALKAGRCALGRMGIVIDLLIRCEPGYCVEERSEWRAGVAEALEDFREFPRSQCYFMPWAWTFIVQRRRVSDRPRSGKWARRIYRGGRSLTLLCVKLGGRWCIRKCCIRFYYRILGSGAWPNAVVDHAEHVLMAPHPKRYIESEIFVPLEHVGRVARFLEEALRCAGGENVVLSASSRSMIEHVHGDLTSFEALRGTYTHHFPITFRLVLKDDTLISMSSEQPMMAISMITMERDPATFEVVVGFLAATLRGTVGARLHWGKVWPLDAAEQGKGIPSFSEFAEQCHIVDPNAVFKNDFTFERLGF